MKEKTSGGFTLVEILVVIAILGILMAMMVPAAGVILQKAKKSTARGGAMIVETGLAKYRMEYGVWPDFAKGKSKKHFTDSEFVETMMPAGDGAPPADNLKRVRFIEGSKETVKDGQFVDPWGNPYQYLVNETPKDTMDLGGFKNGYEGPETIRAKALVWSAGPDGDYGTWDDNVCGWSD